MELYADKKTMYFLVLYTWISWDTKNLKMDAAGAKRPASPLGQVPLWLLETTRDLASI